MDNEKIYGTELCHHCGTEFDFEYNPVKDDCVVCTHCATEQMPCSLCDPYIVNCTGGDKSCKQKIIDVLKYYNERGC